MNRFHPLYIVCILLLLFACNPEEDKVFDQLPTERTKQALTELEEVLVSSPNGWKVCYYTDPDNYGAYNFIMSFDGQKVTMQGDELFPQGKHTSLYSVNGAQGPELSFDTYTILSRLADPLMYVYSEGLLGDNEFVWQRTSENKDTVYFRAKKTGSLIPFIRNQGDWDEYFAKILKNTLSYKPEI